MRNQRVLHSYEMHTSSILSMKTSESFSKIITGSSNGEIFMTDLNKSKYCKIDIVEGYENKPESIISLEISKDNTQIYCSTINSFLQYVILFNTHLNL